jgi:hypothetical protein
MINSSWRADPVDGITGREDQKRDEKAPICCDMHGRNCEPPSELCCRDCSEAAHDTFPIRHADGSVCSAPGAAQGGFERMLADPYEQFDQRGELLKSVIEYANAEPAAASGQASSRDHLTAVVLSVADIEKIKEAAYRAGREDLLRSGSCSECTAGDPHNEPDVPHIHLTPYGYLLYAPDHDQLDFVREIREIERRAGREDAAREERAEIAEEIAQAIEWTLTVPVEEARETYARRRATGDEDQAREWAIRLRAWKSARRMAAEAARGAGVQPTEEQRAGNEDQKRDEEEA